MPILKEHFGATKDGVAVERYHLTNRDGMSVCVLTYGGIVQALHAIDSRGKIADIVLGFDTLEPYLAEHPYFGALIGRYANRIAQGNFVMEGRVIQLATNNGRHHLHGGIHGFDKKVWRARILEVNNACCLLLNLISIDGDEGYPGTLAVEIKYTWNDSNELIIDYSATTYAPTILNLTNHSYFNLAGNEQQVDILKHRIQLCAEHYLPIDSMLIPTGEIAGVNGTCMDFRTMMGIGQHMNLKHAQIRYASDGYDHAWLLDEKVNTLVLAAIVEEPLSGRWMKVFTTQPAIQFYTGNFMDTSLLGKNNIRYSKYAGFCLETQHYPDAPNNPNFPSTVLHPGAIFQETTVYQFGTSNNL